MQFDHLLSIMQIDDLLLIEILIGLSAATAVLCAFLLLFASRKPSPVKKSKPVGRRPAERYLDELAA